MNETEPYNNLTFGEAERLTLLIEECAEVIQAATKILRHGYDSYPPAGTRGRALSNRAHLAMEIGDASSIIRIMIDRGDVSESLIKAATEDKAKRLQEWTHHQ